MTLAADKASGVLAEVAADLYAKYPWLVDRVKHAHVPLVPPPPEVVGELMGTSPTYEWSRRKRRKAS